MFIHAQPGCGGLICVRWTTLWASSGSMGFVGFMQVHPCWRRFHSGSLRTFGRALGFVVFTFRCTLGVIGFTQVHIGGRRVNSGAPWWSSSSFGFFRFVRAHPGRSSSDSFGMVGFLRARLGGLFWFVGFAFVWFIWVCWVHSGMLWWSLGPFWRMLGVVGDMAFVGFIGPRPGSFVYIQTRPRGHLFH